jgi:peptidoglycan LD-endopeptidase CwlK
MSSRDLDDLDPELRRRWELCVAKWRHNYGETHRPAVSCTWRDEEDQRRLYAQGRDVPGRIVTYAQPGQSAHNWRPSLALDFFFLIDRIACWDSALYKQMGAIVNAMGLTWGGSFGDMPHVEVPGFDWREAQKPGWAPAWKPL